ncbi:MAG TPA: hypothetical protein VFE07_07465 [Marmoricola sp.]|nr:hypothetical protein [Marmoricola sp.]
MKNVITRLVPGIAAIAVVGAGSVLVAPAATAAQGLQPLTCDGQDIVVRVPDNHSSDHGGWSAAQVVEGGSGTLLPTSFGFSAYDDTIGQEIFSAVQPSGGGNAHNQQPTVTCTQVSTSTLGDLLEPGDEIPPGGSLSDQVTFSLTVTAVWQS